MAEFTKYSSMEEIPKDFFSRLKRMVSSSAGRAIIIVHPFYAERTTGYSQAQYDAYLKTIFGILTRSTLPIIVLESSPGVVKAKLGETVASRKNIFCLPAHDDNPNIIEKIRKNLFLEQQRDSATLKQILIRSGVRTIQMGGSFFGENHSVEVFAHESKFLPPRLSPSYDTLTTGCAGSCYADLIKSGLFEKVSLLPNACFDKKPIKQKRAVTKRETQNWINRAKKRMVLKRRC